MNALETLSLIACISGAVLIFMMAKRIRYAIYLRRLVDATRANLKRRIASGEIKIDIEIVTRDEITSGTIIAGHLNANTIPKP